MRLHSYFKHYRSMLNNKFFNGQCNSYVLNRYHSQFAHYTWCNHLLVIQLNQHFSNKFHAHIVKKTKDKGCCGVKSKSTTQTDETITLDETSDVTTPTIGIDAAQKGKIIDPDKDKKYVKGNQPTTRQLRNVG